MKNDVLRAAVVALVEGPRHSVSDALTEILAAPGLYSIFGDETAIQALARGGVAQPLYVGKAERSLVGRDVGTHFASGKTGQSTLRRSLAALLREELALKAVPRNPNRPDRSASYGLERGGDERLTAWMRARLCLAVWQKPTDDVVLEDIETAVLSALRPPLNLAKMGRHADPGLKVARATLAAQARAWPGVPA